MQDPGRRREWPDKRGRRRHSLRARCDRDSRPSLLFEWVQHRQGCFWKESVVNEHLSEIMIAAFDDVVRYAETHGVNNRIAAYMLAIDRVAYTIRQRGIYA